MADFIKTWQHSLTGEQIKALQKQPHHDFDTDSDVDRGPQIPYAGANNPKPGQWDGTAMSKRMVADYKRFTVVDGEGVRCSLYVSGCPFHCDGCFQPSIFSFSTGVEYTRELEDKIIADLGYDHVQGLTLLGGEPMLNTPVLIPLVRKIREKYGDSKDVWCWTGYTWEELHREGETPDKLELLSMVDVLVDGRFVKDLADPLLQFRGSSNQRIIDVRKSIAEGAVHIWDRLHDDSIKYADHSVEERNAHEGLES